MADRRLIGAALAAAVVIVIAIVLTSGESPPKHRVSLTVPRASNLYEGLRVRAAGVPVGHISDTKTIDGGQRARITLEITDERAWPLPVDSSIRLRLGGTVAYSARYVAIAKGRSASMLPEGGTVPPRNVEVPVEFDEVFGTFGPRTRENLGKTLDATGNALRPAARPLREALDTAPGAVDQFRGVLADLGDRPTTLSSLVRSTDRVVAAADEARPGVASLIADAQTTFTALGDREADLEKLLDRLPLTLDAARRTLSRADGTLDRAERVARAVRGGVEEVDRITPPLEGALRALDRVAPDARRTLATTRRAAPDLTSLLDRLGALVPAASSMLEQAAPQLACLRPFAPEVAGFTSTWTGFVAGGDSKDKYARLYNAVHLFPNDTPFGAPRAADLVPGAFRTYGFPRAPGANAGQPWYQPGCGITEDGANPQKNPEAAENGASPEDVG